MSVINVALFEKEMAIMADTKVSGNSNLKEIRKVYKDGKNYIWWTNRK